MKTFMCHRMFIHPWIAAQFWYNMGIARPTSLKWEQDEGNVWYASPKKKKIRAVGATVASMAMSMHIGLSCFCVATCKKHTHTSRFKVQASSVSGFSLGLYTLGVLIWLVSYFNSHLNCLFLKTVWEVLFTHATVFWYWQSLLSWRWGVWSWETICALWSVNPGEDFSSANYVSWFCVYENCCLCFSLAPIVC